MMGSDYRNLLRGFLLTCSLILASAWNVLATHLRAGNILMERIGACSERTYRITVIVYTNTNNTNVLFGGDQDYLDFGDRSARILVPEIGPGHPNYTVVDAQRGISSAFYSVIHTFPGPDKYTVSYVEPNRNVGVLNMDNSGETTFYLETQIIIDPFLGCSTPALLLVPPVDRACSGVAWSHNPGAYDPDKDSISYEMVIPFRDRNTTVSNYKAPNDTKFYTNFGSGNEGGTGPPTFNLDNEGTITWDAPGAVGEYNIAFVVRSWRKVLGQWYPSGFVRRDMQIIVEDCDNKRPQLEVPEDVCIEAGQTLKRTIKGTDPDGDEVMIQAYSEIFNFTPPETQFPATVSPNPAVFQSSIPFAKLEFEWNTNCIHVAEQPYQVVFKITDRRGGGLGLVTFKTWRIKVVGPPPTWENATLHPSNRTATIRWDPYECMNAEKMQIWRKVDSTSFKPDSCQTGMPESLGYTKIADVQIKNSSGVPNVQYVDNNGGNGLSPGAMYCYRLVAIYPLPNGGESYVSRDTCVGPLLADVPIMTHVSVEDTDVANGQIRVSWKKPFDADKTEYPPPYRYELYRGNGYTRNDSTLVTTLNGDTTFLDTGLNTEENVFNYSVTAYASDGDELGSAAPASSVRLDSRSQVGQIELTWTAAVPWSNQLQDFPRHLIYRGPEGSTESDLVLIDSVDVTAEGYRYVDNGRFNGEPLDENETYCYRIQTRGGYGNPTKIPEPLKNFSQMVCVQPGDSIPPCKPILTIDAVRCDQFFLSANSCYASTYTNVINWTNSALPECQTDIRSYNIYRTATKGGDDDVLIANVPSTESSYSDVGLPSFARCYRISAIDRSGNESEKSDQVCNDNCPYYELPNVFTPNGDTKNDEFSAFNIRDYLCSNPENCPIPAWLLEKCARFVEKVKFKVYNRWGQELYSYESGSVGSERSIYIDWDGKDENGVELATAVYYYVAEVTFDMLDPKDRVKVYKGWVHLLDDKQ